MCTQVSYGNPVTYIESKLLEMLNILTEPCLYIWNIFAISEPVQSKNNRLLVLTLKNFNHTNSFLSFLHSTSTTFLFQPQLVTFMFCILNIERVLRMAFAGQNHLFGDLTQN